MPSVGIAINRVPDEQIDTDVGNQETYLHFSGDDYIAFGQYLDGIGARVKEYEIENGIVTATIFAREAEMVFSYDWINEIGTVTYPSGTRAETEREDVKNGNSILPSYGGVMPSAEYAINRKPDRQSIGEEGLTLSWDVFTDSDYSAFSAYLAEAGATLIDSRTEAGILNAEIGLNGFIIRFIYNWNEQSATVVYPEGTTPETSHWNVPMGSGSILPDIADIGRELPRISMALKREPSATVTLENGSLQETYKDFSEEDYNTFSQYLQNVGCTLADYYTDETGVLVINLTNGYGKMTFFYDALRHIGIVEYPIQTRIEESWTPTPTPRPITTPAPEVKVYSESECYSVAAEYLKSVLKNPSSLQIHSYRTINYDETYCFVFDYSAQNGFGGFSRSEAYIWITKTSKSVYWSDFK